MYGIQELYRPPEGQETEIDIVAVHGLGGGVRRTWTARQNKVCWLEDAEFLPKYIKNARILAWGYNASYSSLTGENPSQNRIHDHAHTLVANLAADRRLNGTSTKPIIFLCHSLGGIIVKRALSYAQTRTAHKVSNDRLIFTCTYAVLFFGTPHHGTSWANYLTRIKQLGAPAGMKKSDLLGALRLESETLQNITDYFVALLPHLRVYFFWEQEPTTVQLARGAVVRDFVVPKESAAPLHDNTERAGIAADHRGMVKFETPQAQGFRLVIDALMRYCEEAPGVVGQRLVDAAKAMEAERRREALETLRVYGQAVAAGPGASGQGVERADAFRSLVTMEERREMDKEGASLERRGGWL
ncbi:Alpha/Beta hydrolase protein [Schizothecium vesticola]|uniref:Alpha/Beta hydrolase protein n=1 Tax=Schizothecium vesticola TaxID=314040 RepID=A0AA40F3B4_9PEZI|nr:Alpha/Beta hydrolase protein [Schizothecium vesticola]